MMVPICILSNGIINFVLEIFNLILIAVFMLICDVRLSLVVMAGVPLYFCSWPGRT